MTLERGHDESLFDYHKRLVTGKLIDKTLSDIDYSELAELVYGKTLHSDVARRMMYGSCETLKLLQNEAETSAPQAVLGELERKKIELQKERQKFFDERNAYSKMIRERARQEEIHEILVDAIASGKLPGLEYTPAEVTAADNDLLVSLNDMHYGANVCNHWNTYNSEICSAMLCGYIDKIREIAKTHGSENCIVWQNGDAISGNIHHTIAITNKENVIEQVTGVSELIAQFLAELSSMFGHVYYVSVSGNHSRIDPNKDRSMPAERLDDLIEWYLHARLQNFANITIGDCGKGDRLCSIEKIDHTMYLLDVRGKTYCGVHGDFDGSPSKIQSLTSMIRGPIYAILAGHKHHNCIDEVNGVKYVMAGSFLGMDDHCIKNRIFGQPEQMVCVCDKAGIRCAYNIALR